MDVSVIIVNYNTLKMTSECIDSVIEKTHGITYEIILVDNGSTDGSKEHFEQDTRIKYIYSIENLGFGRANNLGAGHASGDYIFFLNPDTILINNAVYYLFECIKAHPQAGGVGGNLYDRNMKPCLSFKRYLPGIRWELNDLSFGFIDRLIYRGNQFFNYSKYPKKVGYITGADLMIRKDVFCKVGGFDKSFFLYYEETDLCKQIVNLGLRMVSEPKAKIQHLEGESFKNGLNTLRILRTEEGRKRYYNKNINANKRNICNIIRQISLHLKANIHPFQIRRRLSDEQLKVFKEVWKCE